MKLIELSYKKCVGQAKFLGEVAVIGIVYVQNPLKSRRLLTSNDPRITSMGAEGIHDQQALTQVPHSLQHRRRVKVTVI